MNYLSKSCLKEKIFLLKLINFDFSYFIYNLIHKKILLLDTTLIITALILFLAAFTQGFSGFGFALVSIPLLSLFVDIKYVIPLGALCGLVVNVYLAFELRKNIKFFELKNLLIGSAAGIPIGVYILSEFNPNLLKTILGLIVLIFVLLTFGSIIKTKNIDNRWGYLFGFFSGTFGGAFNTNGPPVLIYFYLHGWDKLKFKSMITGFFLITSIMITASHAVTGLTTKIIFYDFLFFLPVILLGIFLGSILFKKVSSELFKRIMLMGLLIISFLLIFN
jgi:hypothetical protein